MPTFIPGYSSVVKIGTAASEADYSAVANNADFERMFAELDTTAFGNTAKARTPGLADSSFKVSILADVTTLAALEAIAGVAGKSLVWEPLGSTTGNPKYQVGGFIKKIGHKSAVAGLVTADLEWAPSGAVTISTL